MVHYGTGRALQGEKPRLEPIEPRFRLRPGTRFHSIGTLRTVFSEELQRLFSLDDLNAYVACRLEEPVSFDALHVDLVDRGLKRSQARPFLLAALRTWSDLGLLEITFPKESSCVPQELLLDLGDVTVWIAADGEEAIQLSKSFANAARWDGEGRANPYRICAFGPLRCIGRRDAHGLLVRPHSVVPALKTLLTEQILDDLGGSIAIHAALLERNGRRILISGPPGAGKSTLALALVQEGYVCRSDDLTVIHPEGRIGGIPFPIALKRGSWGLFAQRNFDLSGAVTHRRLDGKRVKYLPIAQPSSSAVGLDAILLLQRRRRASASLSSVSPLRALSELVAGAYTPSRGLTAAQFAILARMVSESSPSELTYSDLDDAVETIERTLEPA